MILLDNAADFDECAENMAVSTPNISLIHVQFSAQILVCGLT